MARRIVALILFASLCFSVNSVIAKELKIGYIISEAIRDQYPEFQSAQKTLDEEKAEWERQYQSRVEEIVNMKKDLDDKAFVYSEARKKEIQNQINVKQDSLALLEKDLTNRLIQRNAELSGPINTKINEILNRIGVDEGYDFIFDANQGNIVYAKDEYDLTNRLLQELQKD